MFKRSLILFLSVLAIQQIAAQEFTDEVKSFIAIDTTVVAIKNVALIDGKGTRILDGQTIVLKKDKIVAIGKGNNIEIPENALIIDGTNKTVIPGLVMLHEHLFYTKFFENWFSVG